MMYVLWKWSSDILWKFEDIKARTYKPGLWQLFWEAYVPMHIRSEDTKFHIKRNEVHENAVRSMDQEHRSEQHRRLTSHNTAQLLQGSLKTSFSALFVFKMSCVDANFGGRNLFIIIFLFYLWTTKSNVNYPTKMALLQLAFFRWKVWAILILKVIQGVKLINRGLTFNDVWNVEA